MDGNKELATVDREIAMAPADVKITNFPTSKQITEYKNFLKNYDKFIGEMLNKGVDYGEIPGVDKPSLFKPGAEKLEKLMFLRHEKQCIEKVVPEDYSFVKYTYRTVIYNKEGQVVATCEGSCNAHEKKYRYKTVFDNQATAEDKANGKLETRMSRNNKQYSVYVVEKKDFADMENTIMKMAQKRSYVGAILEATNSSGRFTQDVEDMDLGNKTGIVDAEFTEVTPASAPAQSSQQVSPPQEAPVRQPASDRQINMIKAQCERLGLGEAAIKKQFTFYTKLEELDKSQASRVIDWLLSGQH